MAKRYQYQSRTDSLVPPNTIAGTGVGLFVLVAASIVFNHTVLYQAKAEPVLTPAPPEEITLDKWAPAPNQPYFDKQRNQYLYPSFTIDANQFTQAEEAKFFSQDTVVIGKERRTQYQGLAFVNTEISTPEDITVDKWHRETQQPRFDIKRNQYLYPSFFTDSEPKEVTEIATVDWLNQEPDQTRRFKPKPHLYPYFDIDSKLLTQAENITLDKWFVQASEPQRDRVRHQFQYTSLFFDNEPREVTEFISTDWINQEPDQVRAKRSKPHLYPHFFPDADLTRAEIIPLDRWAQPQSLPRFDKARHQFQHPSFFFNPEPFEVTETGAVDWLHQEPDQTRSLKAKPHLFQSFAIDPYQLTQGENITVDKWFQELQRPPNRLARASDFPTFFFDPFPITGVEEITLDKYFVQPSEPRRNRIHREFQYPSFFFDSEPREITEFVTVDWLHQEPDRVRASKPTPHLYPSFFYDYQAVETLTLDKWTGSFGTLTIKVSRVHLLPGFFWNTDTPAPAEVVTVDKWFVQTNEPTRAKLKPAHTYFAYVRVDDVVEVVTLDKWFREIQQPIFLRENRSYFQYHFASFQRLRTVYEDKFTPQGSTYDDKFSSRGSSYEDKFSTRGSTYADKFEPPT